MGQSIANDARCCHSRCHARKVRCIGRAHPFRHCKRQTLSRTAGNARSPIRSRGEREKLRFVVHRKGQPWPWRCSLPSSNRKHPPAKRASKTRFRFTESVFTRREIDPEQQVLLGSLGLKPRKPSQLGQKPSSTENCCLEKRLSAKYAFWRFPRNFISNTTLQTCFYCL